MASFFDSGLHTYIENRLLQAQARHEMSLLKGKCFSFDPSQWLLSLPTKAIVGVSLTAKVRQCIVLGRLQLVDNTYDINSDVGCLFLRFLIILTLQ